MEPGLSMLPRGGLMQHFLPHFRTVTQRNLARQSNNQNNISAQRSKGAKGAKRAWTISYGQGCPPVFSVLENTRAEAQGFFSCTPALNRFASHNPSSTFPPLCVSASLRENPYFPPSVPPGRRGSDMAWVRIRQSLCAFVPLLLCAKNLVAPTPRQCHASQINNP